MKEIPKGYVNPFLSDEENEKLNLWNQELEHSNIENEKGTEFYTDKSVMQCELPDFLICYKEGAFHVKDICVDEGICHGERFLFDENNNEMLKTEDSYKESDFGSEFNTKINTALPVLEPFNDLSNMGNMSTDTQIPVQDLQNSVTDSEECGTEEEVIQSIVLHELNETRKDDINNGDGLCESSPESDTLSRAVHDDGLDSLLQSGGQQISLTDNSSVQQDQPLPSLKSLLEPIDQQPCQSPVDETTKRPVNNETETEGNATLNLKNTKPATGSGELSIDPRDEPKLQDVGSHIVPALHHSSEGESSFSVTGPMSGLVTNSGPIGSTSIRSDSSTASARSFAFPILQNEWNSSPVRMAKAEGRRLQKHRGWRLGLCCRFDDLMHLYFIRCLVFNTYNSNFLHG